MWHFYLEYLSFNYLYHLSLLLSLSSFELRFLCIWIAFPVCAFLHSKSPSPDSHLTSCGLAHLSGLSTQNIFQFLLKTYITVGCNNRSGEIVTLSNFWHDGTDDRLVLCYFWLSALCLSTYTYLRCAVPFQAGTQSPHFSYGGGSSSSHNCLHFLLLLP